MNALLRAAPSFLDIFYPRSCVSCGEEIREQLENGLCWDCRSDVHPITPPWCEQCGMSIAGRVDHNFICSDCRENPPVYSKARSLYHYEGGVRDAIHALKYQRDFSVVPDLARILYAGLRAHLVPEGEVWLCPVPLHPKKQRFRGFNQSEELIRYICRLDKECTLWSAVKRVKHTESQTRFSKAGRRDNVRGAFAPAVKKQTDTPRVVLVDDVMTAGATLDAAASAVQAVGGQAVAYTRLTTRTIISV